MIKKVLFVISKTGYQQMEFNTPKDILENAWYEIDVASLEKWKCISWDRSESFEAKYSINDINPDIYELIVFVWWWWTYNDYFWNEKYYELALRAKKVWAICIAPTIISYSWVLSWKKATWWDDWEETQINEMKNNWVIFTWNSVEIDWNIITADWPRSAYDFWMKLLNILN